MMISVSLLADRVIVQPFTDFVLLYGDPLYAGANTPGPRAVLIDRTVMALFGDRFAALQSAPAVHAPSPARRRCHACKLLMASSMMNENSSITLATAVAPK